MDLEAGETEIETWFTTADGKTASTRIDDSQFALTGYSPIGGIWSGTGIVNSNLGVFNPATAGGGSHELIFTFGTGTCEKKDTIEIMG